MFLDDLGNGRYPLRIFQNGVLRDFEVLAVGIQQPLQSFSLGLSGNSDALMLLDFGVSPAHRKGL